LEWIVDKESFASFEGIGMFININTTQPCCVKASYNYFEMHASFNAKRTSVLLRNSLILDNFLQQMRPKLCVQFSKLAKEGFTNIK
jgi:hypothetical protein